MEEMIEKQITLLIPKSEEERFNQLVEGFKQFFLNAYIEEKHYAHESLSLEITSTKLLK